MLRIFNPRVHSLVRANVLVFASLSVAILLAHPPHLRPTLWMLLPTLGVLAGTADTAHCIQRRWSFYHAGVLLCIYMDLMAVAMVLFLLVYPYFLWISATR